MAVGRVGVKVAIEGAEPFPTIQSLEPERGINGASSVQTVVGASGGLNVGLGFRGKEPSSGVNGSGQIEKGRESGSMNGGSYSSGLAQTGSVLQASGRGPGRSQPFLETPPRVGGTKGALSSSGLTSSGAAALRTDLRLGETATRPGWSSSRPNNRLVSTSSNRLICSAVRSSQGEAACSDGEVGTSEDARPTAPPAIPRRRSAVAFKPMGGERRMRSSESLASTSGVDVEGEMVESAQRFAAQVRSEGDQSVNWWESEFPGVVPAQQGEPRQRSTIERREFVPDAEPRRLDVHGERSPDTPKVRKVRLRRTKSVPVLAGSEASRSGGKNLMSSREPLPSLFRTGAGTSTKQGEGLQKGAEKESGHRASAGRKGASGPGNGAAPVGLGRALKALPDRTNLTGARPTSNGSNAASEVGAIAVSEQGSDQGSERTQDGESDSDGPPSSPAASGLNEEQLAAVFAPVGPVRVVAGPGSGKTKVLTNRVAHLVLDRGVKPWNTLVRLAPWKERLGFLFLTQFQKSR